MSGMKSHDCHVFMERLIPVALRELLPTNVWGALTELSLFYRDLCAPKLYTEHVCKLEKDIALLVCKLERIFPPGFFDVMEHLLVHLPYEAKVGGPVQYRWMYPFERYLHNLKIKVKNKARVEGSICNAYLVEEASTFFSYYFEPHVQTRNTTTARNDEGEFPSNAEPVLSICNTLGRKYGKVRTRFLEDQELRVATNYMLLNCEEVQPYIRKFTLHLRSLVPNITDQEVERRIDKEFFEWFRDYVHNPQNNVNNKCLKNITWGPSRLVKSFNGYLVNGYRFHTQEHGEGKKTLNSGVCVKGGGNGTSGSDYYGVLKEIIEVEFPLTPIQTTVLFKCDWFDSTPNRGVKVHSQYKLVDINHKMKYPGFDPFVLAEQAIQVYYAPYPGSKKPKSDWWAVCKTKARHVVDAPVVDNAYQEDIDEISATNISDIVEDCGPLTHESGERELVNLEEELFRMEEHNSMLDEVEEEIDFETDDETDEDVDEYVSDDESDE